MNGCKNEFPRPLKFHLEGTSRVEEFQFGSLEEDKVSVEVQNNGRMKYGCLCPDDWIKLTRGVRSEQRYYSCRWPHNQDLNKIILEGNI